MNFSKYVRKLKFGDNKYVLRNLFNGAIYLISKSDFLDIEEALKRGYPPLKSTHWQLLRDNGFIVDNELYPIYSPHSTSFLITIETTSECNLQCSYCYESDKGTRKEISSVVMSQTLQYIENVFIQDKQRRNLRIGFIGGEPLICKDKVKSICHEVNTLCKQYNRDVHYHFDTNGTIALEDLYSTLNNLHVSISLTSKCDHNKNRKGKGIDSFDRIVSNLKLLSNKSGNSVSIRYNTNDENIELFETFVAFVKANIPICSFVVPMYTDEYKHNSFRNRLNLEDFKKWNSSTAIDILIRHGFKVPYSLGGEFNPCMAYQPYSCKVYADGMVTLCDSMFHDEALCNISHICDNPNLLDAFYGQFKHYNPLNDDCRDCIELARCCGKLFCRAEKCNYSKRFNDDLLANTFVKYYLEGKADFFPNMF